jgi:hypothetical protein
VLVSRSGLPPRTAWPEILATQGEKDGVGRKIRYVQDLEARGTQVMVLVADVTDEAQMQAAIEEAIVQFGTIHGVFHAAGVPGEGLIQFKTSEMARQVLAPKVHGTLVLERVLQSRGIELDLLALFSSLTAIVGGGPGQVDYCAANAFLDAYAQHWAGDKRLTVAIDWDEWQWNAWEERLVALGELGAILKKDRERFGITFEEGRDALERVLSRGLSQIVVSTRDFGRVVEGSKNQSAMAVVLSTGQWSQESHSKHPRPTLGTSYAAPSSDLERKIASVWSDLLGIAEIGVNDNFFELGGNSLIGIELVRRLQKTLDAEHLPSRILYEAPTISSLAKHLGQDEDDRKAILTERLERGKARKQQRIRRRRDVSAT